MNDIMTNHTFFIKRVVFDGDNNTVVELISVTQEICEKTANKTIYMPNIVASHIREIPYLEAKKLGIAVNDEDIKVDINEDLAYKLINEEDSNKFINLVNNIIS
jgi:hypothetical protein